MRRRRCIVEVRGGQGREGGGDGDVIRGDRGCKFVLRGAKETYRFCDMIMLLLLAAAACGC